MNRRKFIKISGLGASALLIPGCIGSESKDFDIEVYSDRSNAHLVFESTSFPSGKTIKTDHLIVGGGVAGLAAASAIPDIDFYLCEVGSTLGGSSCSVKIAGQDYSQGAHYELSYPDYYGQDTLELLKRLEVIRHDPLSHEWRFVDKQHLISPKIESQTYFYGKIQSSVLPKGQTKIDFLKLLEPFLGKMPLPSTLIEDELRYLNDITFFEWISRQMSIDQQFERAIDYHMMDDYGAGCRTVSALAGIHYYKCRPYYTKEVELFSPQEGNKYFINKMASSLPADRLLTQHLVKSIEQTQTGFLAEVIDAKSKTIKQVECAKLTYAGHKHALKHVFPSQKEWFSSTEYAPWVVVNLELKSGLDRDAFWQNEIVTEDIRMMGFVDSQSQNTESNSQVITAYLCFSPEERESLLEIEKSSKTLVDETIKHVENYLNSELRSNVKKAWVRLMGHAMPIPKPGYLFNDANNKIEIPNLAFAGVDNGRLPLFFEAMDSGIQATKRLFTA